MLLVQSECGKLLREEFAQHRSSEALRQGLRLKEVEERLGFLEEGREEEIEDDLKQALLALRRERRGREWSEKVSFFIDFHRFSSIFMGFSWVSRLFRELRTLHSKLEAQTEMLKMKKEMEEVARRAVDSSDQRFLHLEEKLRCMRPEGPSAEAAISMRPTVYDNIYIITYKIIYI